MTPPRTHRPHFNIQFNINFNIQFNIYLLYKLLNKNVSEGEKKNQIRFFLSLPFEVLKKWTWKYSVLAILTKNISGKNAALSRKAHPLHFLHLQEFNLHLWKCCIFMMGCKSSSFQMETIGQIHEQQSIHCKDKPFMLFKC